MYLLPYASVRGIAMNGDNPTIAIMTVLILQTIMFNARPSAEYAKENLRLIRRRNCCDAELLCELSIGGVYDCLDTNDQKGSIMTQ